MEHDSEQGNQLIPLATFFRQQLELMEMLLIEGASSERESAEVLQEHIQRYFDAAHDTNLKFKLSLDGRVVILFCAMKVEDAPES